MGDYAADGNQTPGPPPPFPMPTPAAQGKVEKEAWRKHLTRKWRLVSPTALETIL